MNTEFAGPQINEVCEREGVQTLVADHGRPKSDRGDGSAPRRGRARGPAGSDPGRIFVSNGIEFEGYTDGATKEVIDGVMSSGDVGHFDDEGRLYIDGRDDEMIVSGGENVFPQEVEELLMAHANVADAAVIGV